MNRSNKLPRLDRPKHIYVWGTGRLVGKVIGVYIDIRQITGFIDNDVSKHEYLGKPVYRPEEVLKLPYDAIIVINLYSVEIHDQCEILGFDMSKIIYTYANYQFSDLNTDYTSIASIVGDEFAEIIKKRYHVCRGVEASGNLFLKNAGFECEGYLDTDYVRIKCFELAVKEIRKKQVLGSVAELGVFRGEFAQYLNAAFPDRTLYLFDTFGGFNDTEALNEIQEKRVTETFVEAYKNTNLRIVLKRMSHPEKIVVKQGFFPESLEGLEDTFAFVSLDVDFEESIYQGLIYCYPRLSHGGYIFIHDYNSSLAGVEKAVDRYEADNNIMLARVPLCDANGTLVVTR